jgi:hypothetical protein
MQKILHFMEGESLNNSFFTKNVAIKRLLVTPGALILKDFPTKQGLPQLKIIKILAHSLSNSVTAHFPCREKSGFFFLSLSAACHNDWWLACPFQPPILHKGDSRKY